MKIGKACIPSRRCELFQPSLAKRSFEQASCRLSARGRLNIGPVLGVCRRATRKPYHTCLPAGATVQQAFNTMYQLELSCRSQVDTKTARTELTMPGENVLAHTAHLYQPGTRRPYGVLEWPMLRLLEAEQAQSGYPPYWH